MIPEGKHADIGDGLRVHYHEAGAGRPLVFLHGSGPGASGWSNFKRNFPAIAEAGFRTLVPDTLGFGLSSKPDVDYGMDFLAGALGRFLDGVGVERCALVGNSHGGALAISFALKHPERVERLVLMAPGGLEVRDTYMKMEGIRAMMKAFLAPGGIRRESLRGVLALQLHDPRHLDDALVDERFAVAKLQPQRVLTTLGVPYLAPSLGELRCPVLGLWGMQDRFCPPTGAIAIAEKVAGARVILLNDCGHWVMVEHAALFNRACIEFLRGDA
jgi:4,5:9,10-diseco-3-hydroxy-5,9,17-trioxoandrosta-1(10),2-diene-4-oate hydrolase